MDMMLSMQPPEAPLNATHHLQCLARCTDDATESDMSDMCCTCSTISVNAQALQVTDLRCTSRRDDGWEDMLERTLPLPTSFWMSRELSCFFKPFESHFRY